MKYDPFITVCDSCFRAACWQGEFMCDDSYDAGIVRRRVSAVIRRQMRDGGELQEHPDYWNKDLAMHNDPLLMVNDLIFFGISDCELLELA